MTWLEIYAKTHLFYIILIVGGVVSFRVWLQEHDARVAADNVVKQQQAQVADLKSQIATTQQQAAQKVQVVTRVVHDAVTPSQVVAAIPTVTEVPLVPREIPGNTVDVAVAAQPLMQLAGEAKTAEIQLATCQQVNGFKDQELTAKDAEVVALKKKPKFLKRVQGVAEAIGIGIVIGIVLVK